MDEELRDPLAALGARIASHPYTMEHRVVARVLGAMIEEPKEDTFRKAEVSALDPVALLLLSALVDDFTGGRYDRAALRSILAMHNISPPSET